MAELAPIHALLSATVMLGLSKMTALDREAVKTRLFCGAFAEIAVHKNGHGGATWGCSRDG